MKYIIDTDPGIDDAIAIMLGYLNKLDIIGFTLASGNIEEEKSENNLKVIQDFLESNIKIYKSSQYNECNHELAKHVHGEDGLGYAIFPKNNRKTEKLSAEDFIIKASKKYKDNLTLICFGSLSNLANAIRKDKKVVQRIKHLVIMAVSYAPEEKELYHEFNISVDPLSAKLVFDSPFKDIKVVTHEAGIEAYIDKEYIDNLANSNNKISKFINLIAQKYIEFTIDRHQINGMCAPDPITISSILNPNTVIFKPCKIDVSLDEDKKGTSVVTLLDKSNIQISTNINLEEFRKLFKDTFN